VIDDRKNRARGRHGRQPHMPIAGGKRWARAQEPQVASWLFPSSMNYSLRSSNKTQQIYFPHACQRQIVVPCQAQTARARIVAHDWCVWLAEIPFMNNNMWVTPN